MKNTSEAKERCRCEMPAKIKGENKCWRCKKHLVLAYENPFLNGVFVGTD